MPKLTKRFIETIQPDPVKTLKYWDTELKGFGVVVLPSGRRTYFIKYRNTGRIQKNVKIGVHGHITAEEARNLARIQLGKVAHGEDWAEQTKQVRQMPTINELAEHYLELHAKTEKREKSIKEDKVMLNNYILKKFGNRKLDSITRKEIQQVLHVNLHHIPTYSNRILALFNTMFNLAIEWEWVTVNPVSGIKKYPENKRTRCLQEDEMKRLFTVLDTHYHTVANIIRLLLLTGAKKHEVLGATWDQFDLKQGVWKKESHHTKQKKITYLPLSSEALDILKKLEQAKKDDTPFLFPGKVKGKPLKDIKKSWAAICKKANLQDYTIHDLRHTYASHLVSSGLSLSIVGKLLGHTQASTTEGYAHLADEPLRKATNLFAEKFKELNSEG